MNEDIDALSVRINRLLTLMKKLGDDNIRLRAELERGNEQIAQMQSRMSDARTRVEAALARLPAPAEPQSKQERV